MKPLTEKDFLITDKEIDRITDETKKQLSAQKKVRIMIPKQGKYDKRFEGSINGHTIQFPTDEYIDVPEALVELIESSREVLRDMAVKARVFTEGKGKKVAEL